MKLTKSIFFTLFKYSALSFKWIDVVNHWLWEIKENGKNSWHLKLFFDYIFIWLVVICINSKI